MKSEHYAVGIPILTNTVPIAEGDELLWRRKIVVPKTEKPKKALVHKEKTTEPKQKKQKTS